MRIHLILICISALCLGCSLHAASWPLVQFTSSTRSISEGSSADITVHITQKSYLPVEVPIYVDSSSTAQIQSSEDADSGDYYIQPDSTDSDGWTWDSATLSGKFIISPGEKSKTFNLTTRSGSTADPARSVIFRIDSDNVTVAQPVQPLTHTVYIHDKGTTEFSFASVEYEVNEGGSVTLSFSTPVAADEDIDIPFSIEYITASEDDLDFENSTESPITLTSGSTSTAVTLYTVQDTDIENSRETFVVRLGVPTGKTSGISYTTRTNETTVTVIDNDPVTVSIDKDEEEEDEDVPFATRRESQSISYHIVLSGALPEDLEIPFTLSGSAVFGESDDELNSFDYYLSHESPIVISAGGTSATFTVYTSNDDLIEDTEYLTIHFQTPVLEESRTPLTFTEPTELRLDITDNDPVTLNFGISNPDYDDSLDASPENPTLIPASEWIAAESDGSLTITAFLSDPVAHDITFNLQISGDMTDATVWDSDLDDEQNWDFSLYNNSTSWEKNDELLEVTIPAGYTSATFTFVINDDDESSLVYGQPAPDDIEPDEKVTLLISDLSTDAPQVSFGSETSYTVNILELPDIDITEYVSGRQPLTSTWVSDSPRYHPHTGLHEVNYDLRVSQIPDAPDFSGYRSYKIMFQTGRYDPENPDDPLNDPLKTYPDDPDDNEEFYYYVAPLWALRYPMGTYPLTIVEGTEPINDDTFTQENADTILPQDYVLQQLNLPVLNPEYEDERDGFFSMNDPLRLNLFFANSNQTALPPWRLDTDLFPNMARVFLSRADVPSTTGFSTGTTNILRMEEQSDGSFFLEISSGGASTLQIQYMDTDGTWRVAQPSVISGVASRHYWVDAGPPATHQHPSAVRLRLYRVITNP